MTARYNIYYHITRKDPTQIITREWLKCKIKTNEYRFIFTFGAAFTTK